MKIIRNIKWKEINKHIQEQNKKISHLEDVNKKYIDDLAKKETINRMYAKAINDLATEKVELIKELKALKGAKGGFTKRINQLTKELEETKKKLEESMTDKYLVKKIPMGRLPKGQVMKLKSHAKQDKIIQKVYERLEKEE